MIRCYFSIGLGEQYSVLVQYWVEVSVFIVIVFIVIVYICVVIVIIIFVMFVIIVWLIIVYPGLLTVIIVAGVRGRVNEQLFY